MARSAATEAMPFPVLIGDIGGTNARFALVHEGRPEPQMLPAAATADFPDIEAAIEASLKAADVRPHSAAIDVAGPIVGEGVDLTNAHWFIRPAETIRRLGIEDVVLLNDFEALALALPALKPADLVTLGGQRPLGEAGVLGVQPVPQRPGVEAGQDRFLGCLHRQPFSCPRGVAHDDAGEGRGPTAWYVGGFTDHRFTRR